MNARLWLHSARLRTKIALFGLIILILTLLPDPDSRHLLHPPRPVVAATQGCIELRPERGAYKEAVVREPGFHCVTEDFWQKRLTDGAGHSGPAPYRNLLELNGGDVTIDLQNHVLHSDGHSSGIFAGVRSNFGYATSSKVSYGLQTRNIVIKNGVIDLRGMGAGVKLINLWDLNQLDSPVPDDLQGYEKSNFTLENLLIKTDNIGVVLVGDSNIIRNCIIESGGNGAIMMAGPNGQILNNTIVLTAPFIPGDMRGVNFNETRHFSELFEERRVAKAAIALHQATGTVILGNRIEVRDKSPTRHNIYLTDASENVRIEGNTFLGTDTAVTLVKGSTATMKNNVFVQEKPWWKF